MKPSLCGLADLVRVTTRGSTALTELAELLGYQHLEPTESPKPLPIEPIEEPTLTEPTETPSAVGIDFRPAPVTFWRLQEYRAHSTTDDEAPPPQPQAEPTLERKPLDDVEFVPLEKNINVLTRLRQRSSLRGASHQIDVEKVVDKLSRGEILQEVPRRKRRIWGTSICIIEDRARRLFPYWKDQQHLVRTLARLYPDDGVLLARVREKAARAVVYRPKTQRGPLVLPPASTPVLVLGDLGCLATEPHEAEPFWLQLGQRLHDNGNIPLALTPMTLREVSPKLRRLWRVIPWGSRDTSTASSLGTDAMLEEVLDWLAPTLYLEPGLMREVRVLHPRGRNDAGLEARLWQHSGFGGPHSVARSMNPTERLQRLRRFRRLSRPIRRKMLEVIARWYRLLPRVYWDSVITNLDSTSESLLPDPGEVNAARERLLGISEAIDRNKPSSSELAWMSDWVGHFSHEGTRDPRIREMAHEFHEILRENAEDKSVRDWFDLGYRCDPNQQEQRWLIHQRADRLAFTGERESQSGAIGFPLGMLRSASGEIAVETGIDLEGKDFWRGGQVPEWARSWGVDEFGAWVVFEYQGVEQRLRWIPPGRFLMGSPGDEEGRRGLEGPRHEVRLSCGFWLFDTLCTQSLWTAVMGNNPSEYKSESRPVDVMSWDDVQEFLEKINGQVPCLGLALPTEAQWEYACRAGARTARYHEVLDRIAWSSENSGNETHPVGEKEPNGWGLYDMLGNVWEWCADGMRDYTEASVVDPVGPIEARSHRVYRGGSFTYDALSARAADRYECSPGDRLHGQGFRCASSDSVKFEPSESALFESERKTESAETDRRRPRVPLLRLNQSTERVFEFPESTRIVLRSDREVVGFTRVGRPAWASEFGLDRFGLWALLRFREVEQRLRWIPPGHFLMGSTEDAGRFGVAQPRHEVQLSRGYWLFDTPCTQSLWTAVMGTNPSHSKGETRPVETVSWDDVQGFLEKINGELPSLELSLPTEAQWESACRAGTQTARYQEDLDRIAWYYENSGNEPHPVGEKEPNGWGLYDLLGNVWEWCADGMRDYSEEKQVDPVGAMDMGSYRVRRGGSFANDAQDARAACRHAGDPRDHHLHQGFRCASSG